MHPNRPPVFRKNGSKLICNLCVSFFAFAVLITVIKSRYHSSSSSFSHLTSFLSIHNNAGDQATAAGLVTNDDSLVQDDHLSANLDPPPPDCDLNSPINCINPEVFNILMKAAIEAFPDVHFHRFGKPVVGDDNGKSCDMAWRYRPRVSAKRPPAGGIFKDYRRFEVARSASCVYSVSKIGEYHTGVNARKRKSNGKLNAEDFKLGSFRSELQSERNFSSGKYLVYSGGGDRCKGMDQYLWSLSCALGEARVLNRTLVMDLGICLPSMYSNWGQNEEGKDFRFYFDFEHLKSSSSVIDRAQFSPNWERWQKKHKLTVRLIEDFRVTPSKLNRFKESLILRKFGTVEPDNYWYRVCQRESKSIIRRPWHLLKRSPRLKDIALSIASKLDWDFDTVQVLRPYTKDLVRTIRENVDDGRNLYIVMDGYEADTSVFDPLKEKYTLHFLEDYKELWGEKTEWYVETKMLNNGVTIEFDGYMRKQVNMEVFVIGKKQIKWK